MSDQEQQTKLDGGASVSTAGLGSTNHAYEWAEQLGEALRAAEKIAAEGGAYKLASQLSIRASALLSAAKDEATFWHHVPEMRL